MVDAACCPQSLLPQKAYIPGQDCSVRCKPERLLPQELKTFNGIALAFIDDPRLPVSSWRGRDVGCGMGDFCQMLAMNLTSCDCAREVTSTTRRYRPRRYHAVPITLTRRSDALNVAVFHIAQNDVALDDIVVSVTISDVPKGFKRAQVVPFR